MGPLSLELILTWEMRVGDSCIDGFAGEDSLKKYFLEAPCIVDSFAIMFCSLSVLLDKFLFRIVY